MRRLPAFEDQEAKLLLEQICIRHSIDPRLVHALADTFANHSGSGHKRGISADLEMVLQEYVSDEEGPQ